MGFFASMLKDLDLNDIQKEVENSLLGKNKPSSSSMEPPKIDPENPPTRWEKAVVGMNGIVQQVSTIDPDGIDVVCFPGKEGAEEEAEIFRNVKDTQGLEALVTATKPHGPCHMGKAMDTVFEEAFARGFDRPCNVLVLTAGRPDDHQELKDTISAAAKKVEKDSDLTVTFVQVGDDEWAEAYLKELDDDLTCTSSSGETIDIVDTIKDEDIKKAVGEFKEEGFMKNGGAGALFGAFAGAALGVGGMYMYNKINAKKRNAGWNGKWKVSYADGEEICVLTITDDMKGNLAIEGWPEEGTSTGEYVETEDGYNIKHMEPFEDDGAEPVYGTVEDEHTIVWSDGTRWEEVPPNSEHWASYAAAGTAGAVASGAAGYLIQKKFFKNAANKTPADYVIVLDRSRMMKIPDAGK